MLDPCKSCTSGIDCCGGTCSFPEVPAEFTCAPPKMNVCGQRDERCKRDTDRCAQEPGQPANSCIAGFCAYIPLH